MEPRLEEINKLLINYSLGEFDYKIEPSEKFDEIDAFISNINMLGEELKASTISRNYFNNIFNSVSDMLFVLNNSGKINSANRAATEKLDCPEQELRSNHIDFITTNKGYLFNYIKSELNRKEDVITFDSQIRSVSGKHMPVNCTCTYLYNPHKERIGYLLIVRDQSLIRSYEQSLIESENKYRNIFEKSSDCLFIIDLQGKMLEVNDAGKQLFKISKISTKSKSFFDLIYDSEEREKFMVELNSKEILVDCKLKIKCMNSTVINCLVSISKTYNQFGDITGYQGIVKDMSQQREIENILVRTVLDTQEKERNRIAKDLHDSLGQKLSGIKFHIEALKAMQKNINDKKYDTILNRSNDALNDAMDELSNISFNIMPGTLRSFGLSYAVKELCTKLKLGTNVTFDLAIEEHFPEIDKALEITIFRIIQEFINNSIKHGQSSKVNIKMNTSLIPGSISIILQDNGNGFDMTTVDQYKGMGLKNARSRVESYNGTLRIESIQGVGTKYEILIPYNKIANKVK
jgi:two-component system NarL family sensor kinase